MGVRKWIVSAIIVAHFPIPCLSEQSEGIQLLLDQPLIVGASISADWGTLGPGKRLALRYTTEENIRNLARSRQKSSTSIRSLRPLDFDAYSILIAVDLFFWDSFSAARAETSLQALDEIFARVARHSLTLVLGDIPNLAPGSQPMRVSLNRAIHEKCASYYRCRLLRLDALYQQILTEGSLLVDGRSRSLRELMPDGLHLSEIASENLADRIEILISDLN